MRVSIYFKENEQSIRLKNILLDSLKEASFVIDDENPDVVFVVGGDGTFLKAVKHYLNRIEKVSFLGIKTGHLGYFYDYSSSDVPYILNNIEKLTCKKHKLLEGELENEHSITKIYALNEIRIENPFHTLEANVYFDDEFFELFNGNGLMVSSSIGSSAYNKSLGGAVVDTSLDVLELTEIATIQNNIHRSLGSSLIVSNRSKISFIGDFNNVVVGYDNNTLPINNYKKINIKISEKEVKILHDKNRSNWKILKDSFIY